MNHNHRRTSRHNARLAFDLPHPCTAGSYQIWRIREVHGIHHFKHEGFTMDLADRQTLVVVTNVCPGDVVMITHQTNSEAPIPPTGFRITCAFKPVPVGNLSRYDENISIETRAGQIETSDGQVIHMDDKEIQTFLTSTHPRWLQDYVDEMLRNWRTNSPDTYVNYAPTAWLERDIITLSVCDPLRALNNFAHRLTPDLEEFCILRLTPPQTEPTDDGLPLKLRSGYLVQNATYLLQNHMHQLSNAALRRCALAVPATAYRLRHRVQGHRRSAIMLSSSFGAGWYTDRHALGPELYKEILRSLAAWPEEWLTSNRGGFCEIFDKLTNLLGIRIGSRELMFLFRRIAPPGLRPLVTYIANQI